MSDTPMLPLCAWLLVISHAKSEATSRLWHLHPWPRFTLEVKSFFYHLHLHLPVGCPLALQSLAAIRTLDAKVVFIDGSHCRHLSGVQVRASRLGRSLFFHACLHASLGDISKQSCGPFVRCTTVTLCGYRLVCVVVSA